MGVKLTLVNYIIKPVITQEQTLSFNDIGANLSISSELFWMLKDIWDKQSDIFAWIFASISSSEPKLNSLY